MAQDPIKDGEIAGDDKDEEEIDGDLYVVLALLDDCLLYTSPSPRDS